MTRTKKLNELRVIPLIIFLTSSFIIVFIYILLSDIPLISSLLKDYLISGNSFFFPMLPTINILWFLPKKFQIIPITIGQCIDLIIILNLTCYVESLIYHYIKWTILNKDCQVLFGLSSFYLNNNSEKYEEIEFLQELGVEIFRKSFYPSSANYKFDWKNYPFYALEGKEKYRNCFGHKRKASGPSKLILNIYVNYYLIILNYYVFEYFWNTCLKFRYSSSETNNFADFVEYKGGKAVLKIDLFIFFKMYVREKYESNLLLKKGI